MSGGDDIRYVALCNNDIDRYGEEIGNMIHKDQRYRRAKEQKAKDKMREVSTQFRKGLYGYYYKNGHWAKPGRGKCSKWLKRQSNKAIRRDKDFVGSNGDYKKKYDYWWELL